MNKILYLLTGANGHLGSAVAVALTEKKQRVRALVLPGEDVAFLQSLGVEIFYGNICSTSDLEGFFSIPDDMRRVVIHCAGIVNIAADSSEKMNEVNVGGVKNILAMCRLHPVERLIYVSSVHAIPVPEHGRVIREITEFSPEKVDGAYAKTKAAATALVLESVRDGIPAIVVHPSGIIGPYLGCNNHLIQLIKNYLAGKLPAIVRGGYDFVDVRDCADGILSAVSHGRVGECYILSGDFYEIREMIAMLRKISAGKKVGTVPTWLAKMAAPLLERNALRHGIKPLFTSYSLSTLNVNSRFSHDKAARELGYAPRELFITLRDTVDWLLKTGEYVIHSHHGRNTSYVKLHPKLSKG